MSENEQQGSELPTPYKLERAKSQGSVPRSADLTSIGVLGMALLIIVMSGRALVQTLAGIATQAWSEVGQRSFMPVAVAEWVGAVLQQGMLALAPMLFTMMVVAVVATIAQIGPVFAVEALKPQWARLNPAGGLKRLLSKKSLIDTLKSSIKLAVVGGAIYWLVVPEIPRLIMFHSDGGASLMGFTVGELSHYVFRMFVLLVVFAIIDFALARREFLVKMMMTRREMRDEYKNREGDPRIKGRIRELRQEMLKRTQSLRKVPQADVLLTNPTRIAVALRYDKDLDLAPKVIAKGAGELAARMRALARKHGIPVVHQPSLAREIFRTATLDELIPPKVFPQVAKVMAWAFMLRRTTGAESGRAS
ncbi:MAG: EscU/YscU/HrcU family type III secretion system export apparatus switch protein [Rhodocyclaceae bacterium]